jgi:hypothetical protein
MMTSHELLDIILSALVRAHGGQRRRWRAVVGNIRVYGLDTHPHCNWLVSPGGHAPENAAVERLLDDLRLRHPIVTA